MTESPDAAGVRSTVHKSLIEDDRLFGAPYLPALANALLWVMTAISFGRYRLFLLIPVIHLLLWYLTRHDIHRLTTLCRYLIYRVYYGSLGMGAEFGDELPWEALVDIEHGVLETKDHGLMCTYAMTPFDLRSLSAVEQGAVMLRLNQAFKRLGDEWAVWSHLRSLPAAPPMAAEWAPAAAALLDQEHREAQTVPPGLWARTVHVTFYRKAPSASDSLLYTLFFAKAWRLDARQDQLARFESDLAPTVGVLASAYRALTRLDGSALLTYLRTYTSLDSEWHPVEVPDDATGLRYYLAADTGYWPGTIPIIGTLSQQQALRCVALSKDIPDELWAMMLQGLYRLPFRFDLSARWIPIAQGQAQSLTSSKQVGWLGRAASWRSVLHEKLSGQISRAKNTYVEKQANDADAAQAEMLSAESNLGYLSLKVLLRSPVFDPHDATQMDAAYATVEAQHRQVRTLFQTLGCIGIDEDINAADAVLGANPGEIVKDVRRHTLTSMNLVHLAFSDMPWGGIDRNEHLGGPALLRATTEGCMPFGCDPYVGDLGDSLILGPKGSGKSTFSAFMDIVQWLKYRNRFGESQVIGWDVGGSWRATALFLHGQYYDLGAGEAPLQLLQGLDDDAELGWILGWLRARVAEKLIPLTPDVDRILRAALYGLRERPQLPRTLASLQSLMADHLRHVDMHSNSKIDANGMSRRDARLDTLVKLIDDVKGALRDWTAGEMYGRFVDAPVDHFDLAQVTIFELRTLLEHTPDAYPGVLEALRHRIARRLDGRPTRLLYGEAHEYFRHPAHVHALLKDLPHIRRDGGSACFSTQAREQLDQPDLAAFLLGSCQTRFFLPNPKALTAEVRDGYMSLELQTDEIRQHIVMAQPKAEAYFVHPQGRRRISVRLAPMAQVVCGGNSKEAHLVMDEVLDRYGAEEFPWRYLAACGFAEDARALEQTLARRRHCPHPDVLLGGLAAAN